MAKPTQKICNRCGTENRMNASSRVECESEKFAPAWVMVKRPVNRQVSVEITKPNPQFGQAADRITLSKWWPGGNTSFHLPNVLQWEKIRSIIDNELAPRLGWKTIHQAITNIGITERASSKDIGKIFHERPDIVRRIVETIDADALSKKDFDSLGEILVEISSTVSSASAGFREAFLSVVKKLPKQKQRALEDLALLLQGWSLQAVTNVAQQVRSRLDTIKLFEQQIQDERTYEIRGDDSIHRILERSMWLVDERYWILHSNTPLRKFIGDDIPKKDKKYKNLRPDFVCGNIGKKLVILELKRPSHILEVEDLNQTELYVVLAEDHSNFTDYEAYLVGNKKSDELTRTLKHRSSKFKTLTYSDLLQGTKQKYETFLETIE
jgi:hypothetical protein